MAVIKFSALVNSVSGKLNGSSFANNKGCSILRNSPMKKKKQTNEQLYVQSVNRQLSAQWQLLTEAQRKTWKESVVNNMSGYNLFYQSNFIACLVGSGFIFEKPIGYENPIISDFSIQIQSGLTNLILATPPIYPDEYTVVLCSPKMSNSIDCTDYSTTILTIVSSSTGIIEIGTLFLAKYGKLLGDGERYLFEVFNWNKYSGLRSLSIKKWVTVVDNYFWIDTKIPETPIYIVDANLRISTYSGYACRIKNLVNSNYYQANFLNRVVDNNSIATWLNGVGGGYYDYYSQVGIGYQRGNTANAYTFKFNSSFLGIAPVVISTRSGAPILSTSYFTNSMSVVFKFDIDTVNLNDFELFSGQGTLNDWVKLTISQTNNDFVFTSKLGQYLSFPNINLATTNNIIVITFLNGRIYLYINNGYSNDGEFVSSNPVINRVWANATTPYSPVNINGYFMYIFSEPLSQNSINLIFANL